MKKFGEAESGDFLYSEESSGTAGILKTALRSWGPEERRDSQLDMSAGEYVSDSSRDDSNDEAVLQVYDHDKQVNERTHRLDLRPDASSGRTDMIDGPPQGFD